MIKNLVISGGGLKTIPTIGALKLLRDKGILNTITSYYTTSAGSLFALLLILKYDIEDFEKILFDFNIQQIFEPIVDINNFLNYFNVYDNNKFAKLIKLLITFKLNKDGIDYSNINMSQLYKLTNKCLTCTTVSMKCRSIKYFNHINQPDLPVYKLLLMTCCIPLMFKPIRWKNDRYLDGGLMDNFPLSDIPVIELDQTIGIYAISKLKNIVPEFDNLYDYLKCIVTICTMGIVPVPLFNVLYVTMSEK